jgi:predicted dehydrogenase
MVQHVTGRRIAHVCAQSMIAHRTRLRPQAEAATFHAANPGQETEVPVVTEDAATVLIRLAGGSTGMFIVSQVSAGHKNGLTLEVDCAEGAVRWHQERPEELWIGRRDRPNEILLKDRVFLKERARDFVHYPGGHPEGYPDAIKNLFASVYAHIADRSVPPEFPTFHEAHEIARLIEAMGASHQEGGWIEVKY